MAKLFVVKLTKADRRALETVARRGGRDAAPPDAVRRAQILLKADQSTSGPAWTDARIGEAFDVSRATVERVRKRFLFARLAGRDKLTAVLMRRRPPPRARKVDGAAEAHLIATACGAPPEGHKRWTLRLLAGRLVELEEVDSVSHETVRRILKKTRSSHG